MPVTRRFNRRMAAIGAALALVALPISSTFAPALAQPSPTPSAEAGATGATDTEAAGSSDGSSDGTVEGGSSTDSEDGSTDNGTTEVEGGTGKADDSDPEPDYDEACKPPEDGEPVPGTDGPCEPAEELTAQWHPVSKTLTVKAPNGDPGDLPKSWVGETFDNPGRNTVSLPVQSEQGSTSDDSARSAGKESETDDSGRSVAEATNQADAPASFTFDDDGAIVNAEDDSVMKFEGFAPMGPDPDWTFRVDRVGGKNKIVAEGEHYSESSDGSSDDGGATPDSSTTGSDDDTSDKDPAASDDSNTSASSNNAEDSNSDGTTSDSADTDGITADNGSTSSSDADDDASTSSDSSSSADSESSGSGSQDQADTLAGNDADGRDSNADTGSRGDSSGSSSSDESGSDSASGSDDEKDSDKDGSGSDSGSALGNSDADDTTPDPSTGNGSQDGRAVIPGNTGDEWLPRDEDTEQRPDYSDPVPQNPDEPAPKDDTDLITGGDQPSPRADQNPATSFGESIVSTIVSSWPVFVLAASGMAAVGFIIYLMGRRGKQD